MDLFNFDALVVWLNAARNNLLIALSEIFLRIPHFFLDMQQFGSYTKFEITFLGLLILLAIWCVLIPEYLYARI